MAGCSATREEIEREVARYRDLPTYPHGRVLDPLRRRAAAEVDVALSGSGGDDWFTGSPVHTADLLRDGRWLEAARQYRHDVALPGRGYTRAGLLRTAIAPLLSPPARAILRPLVGTRPPVHAWIRPEFAERVALRERLRWPPLKRARTLVQAEIHRTTNSLMQMIGDELEDRATSAAGLDQRDPFNDRRVVEFGFALPERQRWSAGRTKVVLRRAAAPVLPAMVLERDDKAEFSSTFVEALAALGGRPFFETLQTAAAGWVDAAVTRRMYDEMIGLYTQGRESYIPLVLALWSVAAVELWLNHQHKERSQ
jgi:asparagine synthase (glutamine-hydrolysing)